MKNCMLYSILISLFFSCSGKQHDPDIERRIKLAEQKVDKIMEMMDLPEYGLMKMSKEDLYTSKDFTQAAEDMIKHGRDMKDLDYPDEEFMAMTKEMLVAFDGFESALKTKDKAQIKEGWETVKATCKKCHDIYD
ncbi:MAG: cytochrome c [Lentisphaeraceae bacterium]|nr:cytochrome c [Lentisphaeraceae bacterium]